MGSSLDDDDARQTDGTLAGASGHALGKFLQKRGRRGQRGLPQASAEAAGVLPRAAQPLLPEGICGAPAGTAADDEQPRAGSSRAEEPLAAAQPALPQDGEESDEWEAAGEAHGLEGFLEQAQAEAGGDVVISLGGGAAQADAPGRPRGRRSYSEAEVLCAALVHQAHLLCLLGRARMQDLAAAAAAVQAAAISLAPLRELRPLEARGSSDGLLASHLADLVRWFQQAFSIEPPPVPDEREPAVGGVAAAARRLEAAAASRKGAAEDLVALFVAVLRAGGLLVRYMRALDPLPWRPGASERHVPTQKRAAGGGRAAHAGDQRAGGRGRGKKRKGAAAAAEEAGEGATPAKAAEGRKGGAGEAEAEAADGEAAEPAAGEAAGQPGAKRQRGGKADLEFENQLAMAILASAGAGAGSEAAAAAQGAAQAASTAAGRAAGEAAARPGHGSAWARAPDRSAVADCWAEVFCGGEAGGQGRWVPVHPLLGWLDRPERVEGASVRCGPLAYVVALHGGGAKDVTSRYASNVRAVEKARGPNARWWARTLQPLRRAEAAATREHLARLAGGGAAAGGPAPVPPAGRQGGAGPAAQKQAKARAAREDQELQARVEQQQLETPTTLEGFKNHKHYVLQRHISRYTAVRPGAQQVGLHRGEPFFRTADVSELHTADKWQQLGWQVTDAQLAQPFKEVPRRGAKRKAAAAAAAAGDVEEREEDGAEPAQKDPALVTKLYGKWQTQPWQPPAARDGVVPKNERGTVHCPPLAASLPLGTRQIDRPRVAGVCKRLGVDYAMAMTGFDIRAGRSVPRFQGVVVCEEAAEAVLAEWHREQSEAAEKEARKRMEGAGARWGALLRAIFTRLQLTEAPEAAAQATQPALAPKRGGKKAGGKGRRGRGKAGGAGTGAGRAAPDAEVPEDGWRQSGGGAAAECEEI